jgi:hypothetical protein
VAPFPVLAAFAAPERAAAITATVVNLSRASLID